MSEERTLEEFTEENTQRLDALVHDVKKWRAESDELDSLFRTYGTLERYSRQRLQDLLFAALLQLAGDSDG